jgi:hypothetical protein
MYKPNFCSECGTKLLRLRWYLWTSRKFCNGCARRLRKARILPPLFASLALLSLGYLTGRSRSPAPPPLIIQRRADSPVSDGDISRSNPESSSSGSENKSKDAKNAATVSAAEEVYLCGARTKKGTPCSRRVHGPVRCWQHKGMPAMLPQEKLLVKE